MSKSCLESASTCILCLCEKQKLGLAGLIEIPDNRSILYKRKTIIDMKIQKSVTFNGCSLYLLK